MKRSILGVSFLEQPQITGDIVPASDNESDLRSPQKKFRALYSEELRIGPGTSPIPLWDSFPLSIKGGIKADLITFQIEWITKKALWIVTRSDSRSIELY